MAQLVSLGMIYEIIPQHDRPKHNFFFLENSRFWEHFIPFAAK